MMTFHSLHLTDGRVVLGFESDGRAFIITLNWREAVRLSGALLQALTRSIERRAA